MPENALQATSSISFTSGLPPATRSELFEAFGLVAPFGVIKNKRIIKVFKWTEIEIT
jgi:hypothetical protein